MEIDLLTLYEHLLWLFPPRSPNLTQNSKASKALKNLCEICVHKKNICNKFVSEMIQDMPKKIPWYIKRIIG